MVPAGVIPHSLSSIHGLTTHTSSHLHTTRILADSRELLLSHPQFTMASPEVHHLFHAPIADHSFSADHGMLAVARDTAVELYGKSGNTFKLQDELKGHDKTVTSVDIAPNSGRIVTCSQGLPAASTRSPPARH